MNREFTSQVEGSYLFFNVVVSFNDLAQEHGEHSVPSHCR